MTPNPNPIQSTMNTHHIVKQLKQLKLSAMAEGLDQYLLQAEQNSLDYTGFLSMLLEEELELRDQRKAERLLSGAQLDRKSTRLNSSHVAISYAVFCLKKK